MPFAITDVPGVLVGHAQDLDAITGCTVVLTTAGAVGGVDVRGGAPGTRETDLLNPTALVASVACESRCVAEARSGWLRPPAWSTGCTSTISDSKPVSPECR